MAIKIKDFYANFNAPTPGFPNGSIKDDEIPGDETGTMVDATLQNDYVGFTDALLNKGGVQHSGGPDYINSSDRVKAIENMIADSKSRVVLFDDVASMKAHVDASGNSIDMASLFSSGGRVILKTAASNTTTGTGGAEYMLTDITPGNLSTLSGGVWNGDNHDLGGGYYAKLYDQIVGLTNNVLSSNYPNLDYSIVLQRSNADSPTRVYVMPEGSPSGNTLSSIKVFGDDFIADPVNYRDFNITMAKSGYPSGGTYSDDGAVLLNMKTLGSFRNTENPDMIFCYNDATSTAFIAGRVTYEYNAGNVDTMWTFGGDVPPQSLHASTCAFFTQDTAFKNEAGLRWGSSTGVYNSALRMGSDDLLHWDILGNGDRITINASGSLDSQGRLGSKSRRMPPLTLTYGTSITPDINDGGYRTCYLTGDLTINSPTNGADGDELTLSLTADTSDRTITFVSAYKVGNYSLLVSANTTTVFKFVRRNNTTWDLHSFVEGI